MTHFHVSLRSTIETAPRGSCCWLRNLTRLVRVVKSRSPSSYLNHMTVSCGLPLGLMVARWAGSGCCGNSTTLGEKVAGDGVWRVDCIAISSLDTELAVGLGPRTALPKTS